MKILLDECITKKIKKLLVDFEVHTVQEIGLSGYKNGKLLTQAEKAGYDILLTIDKSMETQQNISNYALTIVILDVLKSGYKYFEELIPIFILRINEYKKGRAYFIER